jgi:hypothetical protein
MDREDGTLAKAEMTTRHNRLATARVEAIPPQQQRTSAPLSVGIDRTFERFLELPVAFVLGVLWVVGVVLIGSCVLVAYAVISTLVGLVAGVF